MGGQANGSPDTAAEKVAILHLPALHKELFSDMKQLPSDVDAYAVLLEGSLPGINALRPSSGLLFQCTVSEEHDLTAGIFKILEQLDSSTSPATYVVVPTEDTFAAWTHEMTVPELPESASDRVKQHCTNLKQYVLLLEAIN